MLDTAPYLIWPRGDSKDQAYLMGVMGSIPFDWCARMFVESHVSFYLLRGLPVPRSSDNTGLTERLVHLSGTLAASGERYADWAGSVGVDHTPIAEEQRQEMIHEVDAVPSASVSSGRRDSLRYRADRHPRQRQNRRQTHTGSRSPRFAYTPQCRHRRRRAVCVVERGPSLSRGRRW